MTSTSDFSPAALVFLQVTRQSSIPYFLSLFSSVLVWITNVVGTPTACSGNVPGPYARLLVAFVFGNYRKFVLVTDMSPSLMAMRTTHSLGPKLRKSGVRMRRVVLSMNSTSGATTSVVLPCVFMKWT